MTTIKESQRVKAVKRSQAATKVKKVHKSKADLDRLERFKLRQKLVEGIMKERLTNQQFSVLNKEFNKFCQWTGVEATTRQASKFRNYKGLANKVKKGLLFRSFK